VIPYWAEDIEIGFSTINARAEEVDTKPGVPPAALYGAARQVLC
jgi:hypothetical protein